MEGYPTKRASHESCIPIAAEIAIRVPAYEPGPSPTVIVSGAPNFLRHSLQVLEKRCGVFSIVRPLARELDFAVQPRQAAARGGQFKGESFHDRDELAL